MKRRWKKFLAGVLSAALALNLRGPRWQAARRWSSCRVTKVYLYPEVCRPGR